MKTKFAIVGTLIALFLVFASANVVYAQWPAINGTGFAVTCDVHGGEAIIGQPVTATAGTTNPMPPLVTPIVKVEFIWHYPNGSVAWDDVIPVRGPVYAPAVPPGSISQDIIDWAKDPANAGKAFWYAQVTRIPGELGNWGVQAIFIDTTYKHGDIVGFTVTRSTSFETVPEVPFGTLAILLSWIGIAGFFAVRKKHLLR